MTTNLPPETVPSAPLKDSSVWKIWGGSVAVVLGFIIGIVLLRDLDPGNDRLGWYTEMITGFVGMQVALDGRSEWLKKRKAAGAHDPDNAPSPPME